MQQACCSSENSEVRQDGYLVPVVGFDVLQKLILNGVDFVKLILK